MTVQYDVVYCLLDVISCIWVYSAVALTATDQIQCVILTIWLIAVVLQIWELDTVSCCTVLDVGRFYCKPIRQASWVQHSHVSLLVAWTTVCSLILRLTVLSDIFFSPRSLWRLFADVFLRCFDASSRIMSSSCVDVFLFRPDPGWRPRWPFLSWFLHMRRIWCSLRCIVSAISFMDFPRLLASMIRAWCVWSRCRSRGFAACWSPLFNSRGAISSLTSW